MSEDRVEPFERVFKLWRETSELGHDGAVLRVYREPLFDLFSLLADWSASAEKSCQVESLSVVPSGGWMVAQPLDF
jgi:hypothetical protein